MLWLIQRDFLEGKTVQDMVSEALLPVANPFEDQDIAQVNTLGLQAATERRLTECLDWPWQLSHTFMASVSCMLQVDKTCNFCVQWLAAYVASSCIDAQLVRAQSCLAVIQQCMLNIWLKSDDLASTVSGSNTASLVAGKHKIACIRNIAPSRHTLITHCML